MFYSYHTTMVDRDNILKQFGNTIREKRLADGMSSNDLSNSVKISRATLSSVENGNGNVSFNTYLDLAEVLGINISFNCDKLSNPKRTRSPKRITKEKTKRNQFEIFCIEKYANHAGLISSTVYLLFKKEGLMNILRTDYEDLHGMGTEYLMHFFDSYLENIKL